uniref:Uncharacterized protein n=1 Tax=Myotis myotis TaxID=51298 RepID=A0A7J7VI83_MYOMY|nr:hypothetical protein mMyoMyo1_008365 [Myotis myotis]
MARGWAPRVAIPQCTVPQRESSHGASRHRALRPGTAGYSTAHKKTRARLPLAPSVFTHLSGRASSLIQSFSAPVSLLLSTPTLLNHVISILKEKCSGGGGMPGSLLSHTYEYVNTFFLKKEKNLDVIILQTTLYSTCVTGPRTLDTNRAMLVYHNMYAEPSFCHIILVM